MSASTIEHIFNRSLRFAFSRRKMLFVFSVLLICGLLIVFCRTLSFGANRWVILSLGFMPVFLSTGLLLAMGVLISRMYLYEVRGTTFEIRSLISQSLEVLIGVSYLALPIVLAYLCLWAIMGLFYFLKEIPSVGSSLGVLFSFGPFLLVCGSLALSLFSLLVLFFVTPYVAMKRNLGVKVATEIYNHVRSSWFISVGLFCIGSLPTLFIVGFLSLAAVMTGTNYTLPKDILSVSLQWFFIMVPFTAILTPAVIFFFQFATESFVWMRKKAQQKQDEAEKIECVSPS